MRCFKHHDAIHSSSNSEKASFTAWHSRWKLQYEDFRMFGFQSWDRFMFILMKTKHPGYIMVFGVVTRDGDIMLPFIFPYDLRLIMEAYIMCLEEVVLTWTKRVAVGRPTFGNRTLHHVTKAGEHNVGCEKISATTSPRTISRRTHQIVISLIRICVTYPWYGYVWNVHRMSKKIEHKNLEIRKTRNFLVQIRTFLLPLSLKFLWHKEREAQSIYSGFFICPPPPNTCGTRHKDLREQAKINRLVRCPVLNSSGI